MKIVRVALAAATVAGASMALAAPAAAGCETNMLGAQYCDGPVRPDGTWDRCWHTDAFPVFGQWGQVTSITPAMGKCYPVNPAEPWPVVPIGQPQYHIYP